MKLRPFELAILFVFGLLALLSLGMIATYKPPADTTAVAIGTVEIWGTLDRRSFETVWRPWVENNEAYKGIYYVQKDPATFDSELLNALAEQRGPDIVLLPHEELVNYRSKLRPIPYENLPLRDFRTTYIDGAEIFALTDGVYALPLMIDPLVMYWNRDILGSKGVLTAPRTWEEVVNQTVPQFVVRDQNRTILQSPLAFGEYRNVSQAQAVLSMLTIQGGSLLVQERPENTYAVLLNQTPERARPLESAVTFYTNFGSPSSNVYTWNRAQPLDTDAFLSEDLILYFGKGSEARSLEARNPNLNFDIAPVPQGAAASVRRTYGTFYGLALLRTTDNVNGAYAAMQLLAQRDLAAPWATSLGMAPAYRDLLTTGSTDTYGSIVYESAITARGWLAPAPARVDSVFTQMVEDILANRRRPGDAASDAVGRMGQQY